MKCGKENSYSLNNRFNIGYESEAKAEEEGSVTIMWGEDKNIDLDSGIGVVLRKLK